MQRQKRKYRIRLANTEDLSFLQEMLYEAAFWRTDGERPPIQEGLARPDIQKVLRNWGRPGDKAVIAVDRNNMPLGAAWYRFWSSENHSYGFVDESTPEVGIGVRVGKRRQGVGTALLQALLKQADKQGIQSVSLSVDPDNYARKIYEKIGFKKVDVPDNSWTMVVDLASEKKKA